MSDSEHAVIAIKHGNLEALQKLISESVFSAAELYELLRTAIMPDSKTPRYPNQRDMVQSLIDAGADINGVPQKGPAPLRGAISVNDVEIAELLLQQGADPNGVAGDIVRTPLEEARRLSFTACEQLLLRHGATSN
jgi:ankyrin repeat protein